MCYPNYAKRVHVVLSREGGPTNLGPGVLPRETVTRVSKEPLCRLGLPIRLGVGQHSQHLPASELRVEEEEEDLFVFNDTIEGPRAPAVKPGRVTRDWYWVHELRVMGTGVFSSDAGYADLPLTLLGAPVETLISLETEKKSSAPETRVRRHNRRIFEYHGVLFLHSCLKLSESCRITGNIQTFIGVPRHFYKNLYIS